jgi:hypothetical protein
MENTETLYFIGDIVNGRYNEPFRSYDEALSRYYADMAESLIIEEEKDKIRVRNGEEPRTAVALLKEVREFYFIAAVTFDADGQELSHEVMPGKQV